MNTRVRKATEADFDIVLSLINEFATFQQTPQKVTLTIDQMREDKHLFNCLLVEAADGNIAGFASYFFTYHSWTGKAIYLDDLYIKPASRNLGIGKKLLSSVIEIGKNEQCKKLRWQVSKWNENAIDFYKKMGAVVDDVEINCDLHL